MPPTLAERFRRADTWATKQRNVNPAIRAAFPTCHENNYGDGRGIVYGTYTLDAAVADFEDVPKAQLPGSPDIGNVRGRMTGAYDYAVNHPNAYVHGFPTFHHRNQGTTFYGTVLIKPNNFAELRDVPLTELGMTNANPDTRYPIEDWFRRVDGWKARRPEGWVAAMPTGHRARYGGQWVMGVILFKPGTAQFHDVPASALGYQQPPPKQGTAVIEMTGGGGVTTYKGSVPASVPANAVVIDVKNNSAYAYSLRAGLHGAPSTLAPNQSDGGWAGQGIRPPGGGWYAELSNPLPNPLPPKVTAEVRWKT